MPFCEGHGEHGGASLDHKTFSCWQCGEGASPPKLVKQILGCSWAEAYRTVEQYSQLDTDRLFTQVPISERKSLVELPPLSAPLVGPGGGYIKSRGLDPGVLEAEYGVKEIGVLGDYRLRLIIPVYVDNTLVTFTTRRYVENSEPKYKAQPPEKAIIPIKHCLYNIDTVKDQAIIVEGPVDVWKLGIGSVALFGTSSTVEQQEMLVNRGVKRVFIMLDPGTEKPAEKLYFSLISLIREIKIVRLEGLDPGGMTQEEAINLKLQLL